MLLSPDQQASHAHVCRLLDQLSASGHQHVIEDADERFPTYPAQREFLEGLDLRGFAIRRKVSLGRTFGSRRSHFAWLPAQFLLVYDGTRLCEVLPCRIAGNEIEPLEYLEQTAKGEPWTIRSGKGMEGKWHKHLVDQIIAKPDLLEMGLVLRGTDVQVSQDGEIGFIDLVFVDHQGRPLLVEVNVDADELAKAIGQILWHRRLFCAQNNIAKEQVRVAICCRYVPPQYQALCAEQGISWFQYDSPGAE